MSEYVSALMVCLQPVNLLLIVAMVSLGIVFGAIPGLSATLGIALLLPVTFGLSTETSFVLLLAIWIGGVSGTFISAVLIGIPGSSSAIATCFDGFPMTKNGQASKALGIGMTASFIGTVGSVALATVLSPVIAEFALHLGPWEYFSLCFCAITLVASLSKGNIFKGIMAAGIGLLMGCIGMDPINGSNRFTFGNVYLSSGISTVAQMLGMFAMCQIIRDSARGEAMMPEADMVNMKGLGIGIRDILQNIKTIAFASPVIAEFALHLGPWEYFSLCFCAITLVASLSKGNIFKGIMAAGIGLLMGCIGMDPINGSNRFTFGNVYLSSGISTVAQMLGMFAMCQIIRDSARGEAMMPEADMVNMKGLGIGIRDILQNIKTIAFAFVSGLWIGFLPGMGSGISNMVAYGYAKSISKEPESFGKGNPAGVWASETANNASLGGALIPMMALGIPGDGITAMLIAGLTIHGLQAGPLFMTEQPDLTMLIFACVMVAAIVTYIVQIIGKRWFPYILKVPYHYLYTVILVICYIGGYGISNTMFNIYVMLALCLLAIFMSISGLPTSPLVLAFILSSKLERYFRQGISYAHGSYKEFFTRPLSCALLLVSVFCVVWPLLSEHLKKKKAEAAVPAAGGSEAKDD